MKLAKHFSQLTMAVLFLLTGALAAGAPGDEAVADPQVRQALAERDEIIINLLNRVQILEQRLSALDSTGERPMAAVAQAAPAGNAGGDADGDSSGGFVVDELAAERALERGLVQQGVRLLRAGQAQVAPTSSYARLERRALAGNGGAGEVQRETEIFDTTLQGRLGLPFNAQLEVSLPYRNIDISRNTLSGGAPLSDVQESGNGWGNARVGIASRLLQESVWRPELVGRLTWLTGSGDASDSGVSLGGNYSGFGLDFNATWRRDPVVFLLGAGYFRYDHDDLQPGDTINLSVGASLAISPETALTFSLNQSFADDFQIDGRTLPGTDQVSSLLNISASTLLGRGSLLQVNAGIGLTPDAPDYLLGVSLPFDAGFLW